MTGAREVVVTDSASPISFETEGGGSWKVWDRYIALDGKRAFHIGNICGTCAFFFQRLGGANRSVSVPELVSELNTGVVDLGPPILDALKQILPDGRYRPVLLRISPKLVAPGSPGDYFAGEQIGLFGLDPFWGLPHDPRTEYYRLNVRRVGAGQALYEFLVPTFPSGWLKRERVDEYSAILKKGGAPTAVALGILDVKEPARVAGDTDILSHWCFANYLLDGHHKVFAASQSGMACSLLSFVAMDRGIASESQVDTLMTVLEGAAERGDEAADAR